MDKAKNPSRPFDRSQVEEFEARLDQWLLSHATLREPPRDVLIHLGNIVDTAGLLNYGSDLSWLSHGFDVLVQHLNFSRQPTVDADYTSLMSDLWDASRYFSLRELLYYTYNAPGAVSWEFESNEITIRYNDRTIPRQFYLTWNNFLSYSRQLSEELGDDNREQIHQLLAEAPEFQLSETHVQAWPLLEQEADAKLRRYYSLLDPSSTLDLGGYTYREFYAVFRILLVKALYHRHLGQLRDGGGAVTLEKQGFIDAICADLELPHATASQIIGEMTYTKQDRARRLQPVYFSLYEIPHTDTIMMIPAGFAIGEGIINMLRLVALRRPKLFSDTLSAPLSNALVNRVRDVFEACGFSCRSNVKLNTFDQRLPDIDLLAISEELTLGYYIYVLEIKNPLPPRWAKDHLRVLEPNSIPKAFTQLDRIVEFLHSAEGVSFLRTLLPREGLPHFGPEYITLVRSFVVTSHNAGMFFGDAEHTIIDYRTLERIVRASDGDVTFINHALQQLDAWIDDTMVTAFAEVEIDGIKVRYEGVTDGPILDFTPTEYRSIGLDQQIAHDFRESGGHPFDVLHSRPGDEAERKTNEEAQGDPRDYIDRDRASDAL